MHLCGLPQEPLPRMHPLFRMEPWLSHVSFPYNIAGESDTEAMARCLSLVVVCQPGTLRSTLNWGLSATQLRLRDGQAVGSLA